MNAVVIIPALNPDAELIPYVKSLLEAGVPKIIVVDDGSTPEYQSVFTELRRLPDCEVFVHEVNQGKGAALKHAFRLYLDSYQQAGFDGVITVDADGQHTLEDVKKVAEAMEQKLHGDHNNFLVVGERTFGSDVPFRSKFGNTLTSFLFHLLYHKKMRDTQTGLRGLPNGILKEMMELRGERYEYEMNMLIVLARQKADFVSVPIETIYLNDNASSHFNPIVDSFKIYRILLGTFAAYALTSLSSSILDMLMFQIFVWLLKGTFPVRYILISTIGARIVSSIYNFTMNHKVVFRSNEQVAFTAIKYFILCVVQMLLSAGLVDWLYVILPVPELVVKIIVDTILFFVSYFVQKRLIFRSSRVEDI